MALVIAEQDFETLKHYADLENLDATPVLKSITTIE